MDLTFTDEERTSLLRLACQTIRSRLAGAAAPPQIRTAPPGLTRQAGCFVTLHNKQTHALRGCIGRIDASTPLVLVLQNSAWQVVGDPRFVTNNPVKLTELPALTVELSILGHLKPCPTPLDFSPGVDGMYMTIANRSGVFLPTVARETGWTREQLLDRLCQEKMGVPPRAWQDAGARLFAFESITIGPVDFLPE